VKALFIASFFANQTHGSTYADFASVTSKTWYFLLVTNELSFLVAHHLCELQFKGNDTHLQGTTMWQKYYQLQLLQ